MCSFFTGFPLGLLKGFKWLSAVARLLGHWGLDKAKGLRESGAWVEEFGVASLVPGLRVE